MKKVAPTRRKFLGFMAASPLAAKKVAETESMKLSGISESSTDMNWTGNSDGLGIGAEPNKKGALQFLLREGIPEWKKQEMKREARSVYSINTNISTMVSPSLSGKVSMQRKQNYRNAERGVWDRLMDYKKEDKAKSFFQKFGIYI